MNTKEAYEIVYKELSKCSLLIGRYDAKNGSETFMNGIATVMGAIANGADPDNQTFLEQYEQIFAENIQKSIDKAKEKCYNHYRK